jgi:hypothetical protein
MISPCKSGIQAGAAEFRPCVELASNRNRKFTSGSMTVGWAVASILPAYRLRFASGHLRAVSVSPMIAFSVCFAVHC